MPSAADPVDVSVDREALILDAALHLLAQRGISGVSMRAVAREADVALGLVNYYYTDKVGLIAAALRRIEEADLGIVSPDPDLTPRERLLAALHRIADPEFLASDYLALRLQLWSLSQADPEFARINVQAQSRYRKGLTKLIRQARPDLDAAECARRAADINVVQNGVWLTALLGLDKRSIQRGIRSTEDLAFDD